MVLTLKQLNIVLGTNKFWVKNLLGQKNPSVNEKFWFQRNFGLKDILDSRSIRIFA